MIVLYIMSNGTPQENLKQIFRVFDINNDGFISLKELQRIVKDLFHLINEENADEASQELLAQSGETWGVTRASNIIMMRFDMTIVIVDFITWILDSTLYFTFISSI